MRTRLVIPIALISFVPLGSAAQDEAPPASEPGAEEESVPDLEPAAPRAAPLALTISGGVSLGAYEAGVLHYALETLRRSPERARPLVFAGTSAGSINAFLSVLSYCGPPARDPESSRLFRTWAGVGIAELYDPERVTANALFDRGAFADAVGAARRRWNAGLRRDCDVLLGITATRLHPRDVAIEGDTLVLPRMAERFLVRIRGRGPGLAPRVENFVIPGHERDRPLLPLDGAGADAFSSLVQAILASSAFPVAFAPQPIAYCPGGERCQPADAEEALFLDGSFYSNQPLGLAVDAMRAGASESGPSLLLDRAVTRDRVPPDSAFFFVDPALTAFPTPEDGAAIGEDRDLIPFTVDLTRDFIRTARSAELDGVVSQIPEIRKLLFTNRVQHPTASAGLGAFMGFFERELRRFDFHLGMYDARRTLIERLPMGLAATGSWGTLPDEVDRSPAASLGWRPFDCMRYVFDGRGEAHACAGEDLRDFRVLLRLSLERLWDVCVRTDTPSPRCADARAGRAPPRVPHLDAVGRWRSDPDEAHYDWMLRRLGELGFSFRDLGLDPSRADEGGDRVRDLLADMSRNLARAQEDLGLPVEIAAEALVSSLRYRAPRNLVHVGFGTGLDFGWSGTLPGTPWEWLRLTVALELRGIPTLISSQPSWFGLAPLLGVELELLPLSGGIFQPRLGFRGGFIFSTGDELGGGSCDVTGEEVIPCSRPVTQGYLTLSFFQVLRLNLIAEVQPAVRAMEPDLWEIRPGIALSIPLQ